MKRIITLMLCTLLLLTACSEPMQDIAYEPPFDSSNLRPTVLCYATNEGRIVPVVRRIVWNEGIAVCALSYLVSSEENTRDARMHGLCTTIPDGTEFSLHITDDKCAQLDVQHMPALPDEKSERIFLQSVVNTLTEFDSIETVSVTFDGEYTSRLPHGTRINNNMKSFMPNPVNTETETMSQGATAAFTVYVPDKTCRYILPLTCYGRDDVNFETAMQEFCKCCNSEGCALPDGTYVLSAALSDGTCAVNFSDEFSNVLTYGDGVYDSVYEAIYLTAGEFGDVQEVRIFSGSEPVSADADLREYVNEW